MPIRGAKSPVPKKIPAKNSGIFSNSGAGQKKDPVSHDATIRRTLEEAYKNTNHKAAQR